VRGRPLFLWDRFRDARISRRRASVERVFTVVKRVFGGGHVLVTTVRRVHVRMVFACLCFNLLQMRSLGVAQMRGLSSCSVIRDRQDGKGRRGMDREA